jgi:hypothetical protein
MTRTVVGTTIAESGRLEAGNPSRARCVGCYTRTLAYRCRHLTSNILTAPTWTAIQIERVGSCQLRLRQESLPTTNVVIADTVAGVLTFDTLFWKLLLATTHGKH